MKEAFTPCLTDSDIIELNTSRVHNVYYAGQDVDMYSRKMSAFGDWGCAIHAPGDKDKIRIAIGDHIAFRYKILHTINRGGQGVIFRVADMSSKDLKHYALKVDFERPSDASCRAWR